jgi:hypothetical protein
MAAEELDLYKKFQDANESIATSSWLTEEEKKVEFAAVMLTYKKGKAKLRRDAKMNKMEEKRARVAAGEEVESRAMRIEAEGLPTKEYVLYAKFKDAMEARGALRELFAKEDWMTPLCGRVGASYLCAYHCTEPSVADPPLAFKITSPEKAGPGLLYVWVDNVENDKVSTLEGTIELHDSDGENTESEDNNEMYARFKESELLDRALVEYATTTFDNVLGMNKSNLKKVEEAMMKMTLAALKLLSDELRLAIDTQGTRLAKKHIVKSLMDAMGEIKKPDA